MLEPKRDLASEVAGARRASKRYPVKVVPDVVYAVHDGDEIRADFYLPDGPGPFPAMVMIHGGGGEIGDRGMYATWAVWLAERGIGCMATSYRLTTPTRPTWQMNAIDCIYSVKFLRGRAAEFNVDPEALGVMGGSAGANLTNLVALAAEHPAFASPYRDDPYRDVSARVKVAVPIYGSGDRLRSWEVQMSTKPPGGMGLERQMGGSPMDDAREHYYLTSGPFHATRANAKGQAWLVVYGTADQLGVEGPEGFLRDLRRTGAIVHNFPMIGAPHGFMWQSHVEAPGSWNAQLAPRLLWFLRSYLR